jgi:hypothetical protein
VLVSAGGFGVDIPDEDGVICGSGDSNISSGGISFLNKIKFS